MSVKSVEVTLHLDNDEKTHAFMTMDEFTSMFGALNITYQLLTCSYFGVNMEPEAQEHFKEALDAFCQIAKPSSVLTLMTRLTSWIEDRGLQDG